jgi:hypothetical protein
MPALMSLPKNGELKMNFKIFLIATTFTLATIASANADTTCAVNSPDGELNVRDLTQNGPGRVIGVVKNGYNVTMRDFYFLRGQSWARVLDGKTKTRVVGWVFKDYLNCNGSAPTNNGNYVLLKRSGAWTAYTTVSKKGEKIIGMYTVNDTSGIYVKYFGNDQLVVQLFKKGWGFPTNGVDVPFSIQFDHNVNYPATGRGVMDAGSALLEASFKETKEAGGFMNELMEADTMTITFSQGNERPWVADMKGSREVGQVFMAAVKAACSGCMTTQPYDTTSPSQPYDSSKPTAKNNNDI